MKYLLICTGLLLAIPSVNFAQEVSPKIVQNSTDSIPSSGEQAVLKTKTKSNQSNDKVIATPKDSLDDSFDDSIDNRLKSKTKSNQSNDRKAAVKDSIFGKI